MDEKDLVTFEEHRRFLFGLAYRMLGTVGEAEDVVQEAYLRFAQRPADEPVEAAKAYLATVVTRLAIDRQRSARARREHYVGTWLPEPLVTEDDPADAAELSDSLSLAFLTLLESLTPVERAVFLLREVFEYDYAAIAEIVGKSEDNCRQIMRRARLHVDAGRPRFDASREERRRLAERFFAASREGDVAQLESLLAEDVALYGDGGGNAPSWKEPVTGRDRVAPLLARVLGAARRRRLEMRRVTVNGEPGAAFHRPDGSLVNVVAVEIGGGSVRAIRSIVNPDKLRHLA